MHNSLEHNTTMADGAFAEKLLPFAYEKPQLMELAVCDGVVRGTTGYDMGGGTQGENGNYNWGGEEATTEE